MAHTRLYDQQRAALFTAPYQLTHWELFDYNRLAHMHTVARPSKTKPELYNDCFVMCDTETSKKTPAPGPCHVCAWTISIRAFGENLVTLYGSRPDTFCNCLDRIKMHMPADHLIVYFHNLAYDYVFLRKFLFAKFGTPDSQLNTKPYYPISIKFKNGLQIRDSLILAQRKLEKWAEDLDVEHKKATGKWDYRKIRDQSGKFTRDELEYIEHDTLAGVECLDATCRALHKHVYSMPYTATGIPRDDTRKIGKKFHAHDLFLKCCNDWELQQMLELLFHGGYTHANRNLAGWIIGPREDWIQGEAVCMDFASSYPYSMLVNKFPMTAFKRYNGKCTPEQILQMSDRYAFMFIVSVKNPRLKNPHFPMPMLQISKCLDVTCYAEDNGRIMSADRVIITFNEYDLALYLDQYDQDEIFITDVCYAMKDYLPRWLTDYIYQLFCDKSDLKGKDPVLYAIIKAKLNSVYGMCVQRPVRIDIKEDYDTGTYYNDPGDGLEAKYKKYTKNYNNVLSYAWGVWVTSESMYRLFQMSKCIDYENGGEWIYSDTDSIYSTKWDMDKLETFNNEIRQKLTDRGYGPYKAENGKEYCLGVATFDGKYTEFVALGAKRYCGRSAEDGQLHITVAGVPKKGAETLRDNIERFRPGLVFDGKTSGKLQHTYYMIGDSDPYLDDAGNLTADSIDLGPCDYLLDSPYDCMLTDEDGYMQLDLSMFDADEIDLPFVTVNY